MKELPQALIRNTRVRDVLASRFGCNGSDLSITQAGRIKIPGRGTIVNNVDDFWTLLFGSVTLPKDPTFNESAPYCMNCESWGDRWVREMCRECMDPRNNRSGTQYVAGPCMTCSYFKRRPADADPPDDPPAEPTKPKQKIAGKGKQSKHGKARTATNAVKGPKK